MESMYDTIWLLDSIVTLVLKTIGIIAVSIWIIFKKGGGQ
jgi:hypothetical protein